MIFLEIPILVFIDNLQKEIEQLPQEDGRRETLIQEVESKRFRLHLEYRKTLWWLTAVEEVDD